MADHSKIAWTEATWNPVVGCSHASPGCEQCYAERMALRLALMGQERYASVINQRRRDDGAVVGRWSGKARCVAEVLSEPLQWRRPRRVFVCSMGDLFHESVPDEFIDRIFSVMRSTPRHTYQVLTKRADRMRKFVTDRVSSAVGQFADNYGDNVWLGVTAEDQQRADERVGHLLMTPAAVRFVSVEPMIGPVDLSQWLAGLDWAIVGGESGHNARECGLGWVHSIVAQCQSASVPVFVKQLHLPCGNVAADGWALSKEPSEWPEDLRVRQMPEVVHA